MSEQSYWAVRVRLPYWRPEFRDRLLAAEVDPGRVPVAATNQAVDLTMELFANNQPDAEAKVWTALDDSCRIDHNAFVVSKPMAGPRADRFQEREPLPVEQPAGPL